MNAVEIEEAITLLADQPFDPESFPFAFLEAFGNKATTIKRLKSGASNASDIEGGVKFVSETMLTWKQPKLQAHALTPLSY